MVNFDQPFQGLVRENLFQISAVLEWDCRQSSEEHIKTARFKYTRLAVYLSCSHKYVKYYSAKCCLCKLSHVRM